MNIKSRINPSVQHWWNYLINTKDTLLQDNSAAEREYECLEEKSCWVLGWRSSETGGLAGNEGFGPQPIVLSDHDYKHQPKGPGPSP